MKIENALKKIEKAGSTITESEWVPGLYFFILNGWEISFHNQNGTVICIGMVRADSAYKTPQDLSYVRNISLAINHAINSPIE